MTFDELLRAVRREIKEASARRWQDADIKDWLNQRYLQLASVARLQRSTSIQTVAGTALYDLPADLLEIQSVYVDGTPIAYGTFPRLEAEHEAWPTAEAGKPCYWFALPSTQQGQARQIQFWPTPDTVYTVSLWYHFLPERMVNTTDVPLIRPDFHWAIVLGATASAWAHVQEYNVAELYESKFIAQRAELELISTTTRTDLPRKVQVSR